MRKTALLLVALALIAAACSGSPSPDVVGGELYSVSCARCHADDLSGGIGPALGAGSTTADSLTDEQVADVIRIGPGAMPGFPRLSDQQIDSLVDYLREQEPEG